MKEYKWITSKILLAVHQKRTVKDSNATKYNELDKENIKGQITIAIYEENIWS